jgi:hypothetical protein
MKAFGNCNYAKVIVIGLHQVPEGLDRPEAPSALHIDGGNIASIVGMIIVPSAPGKTVDGPHEEYRGADRCTPEPILGIAKAVAAAGFLKRQKAV